GLSVGRAPASAFTEASAGRYHACALASDGSVVCWGSNTYGESTPPAGTFVDVSAAGDAGRSCGVRVDGTAACWGDNEPPGAVFPPAGGFVQVAVGYVF